MAFNPINFLNAPRGTHPLEGLSRALAEGYQLGQMPFQMWDEQKKRQLENAMSSLLVQQEPQRFQMAQETGQLNNEGQSTENYLQRLYGERKARAGIDLMEAQAENQRSGGDLTGLAREVSGIESLKDSNPEAYEKAKHAFNTRLKLQEGLLNYRNQLSDTAPKRASTQLGKIGLEKQEMEEGYLPGSNKTIPLSKDEQASLLNRYDLQQQKLTSDVDTRKRALFASNIDKTLNSININDLTQYAGLAGKLQQKVATGQALTGEENKKYEDYQKALVGAKLLSKQVRQFYGDSITPQVQEKLNELTNPATWANNPKIAKSNFEAFSNILKKETQTYRNALKGASEFKDNSGTTTIYRNGKAYQIPNSKVKAALSAGGSLNG